MNEPLQQSTAQGLNEADPAENLTTPFIIRLLLSLKADTVLILPSHKG